MTIIEQLEAATAQNAELTAKISEATAKIAELEQTATANAESAKVLESANAKIAELTEAANKSGADLVAANAEIERLKAQMALKPAAFNDLTNGGEPVKDGAAAAEEKLADKFARLNREGKYEEARELYKQHKAEFKRLAISRS